MPFAAALSTVADTSTAFEAVCRDALSQVPNPELAVVFVSPHHVQDLDQVVPWLADRLAGGALIGCMGEAIAGGALEIEHEPAVSLWVGRWNGAVALEPFSLTARQTPDGPSLMGWPDAMLDADPNQSAMILLGDPLTFPVTELFLPRLKEDHRGLSVVGGMASGNGRRGQTALVFENRVVRHGAVGVLLRGPLNLRCLVSQGCRPIGRPFVITKGQENLILELGGKSPLDQLRELWPGLTPRDQDLFRQGPHLGLVIDEYRDRFERGDFLVRNLAGIDAESGAMALMDFIRVGQTVQFHVRDAETANEDLQELLRRERKARTQSPGGALLFSCNGRGTRLFGQPHHDAAAIQRELGDVPLAGFFAAGELGPVGGQNFIHGFTASVALFDESTRA